MYKQQLLPVGFVLFVFCFVFFSLIAPWLVLIVKLWRVLMHFPHPGEKPPVELLCVEALWLNPAELSVLHRPFIPSQPYWLGPDTE